MMFELISCKTVHPLAPIEIGIYIYLKTVHFLGQDICDWIFKGIQMQNKMLVILSGLSGG